MKTDLEYFHGCSFSTFAANSEQVSVHRDIYIYLFSWVYIADMQCLENGGKFFTDSNNGYIVIVIFYPRFCVWLENADGW